jgi:hypothetical protein
MHAVVTTATVHDPDRGRTFLEEQAIPQLRQAPGFVSAQWVLRPGNKGAGMLTFESEEAAQAAAEQVRTNRPPDDVVTIDTVEVGEVVQRV